MSTTIRLFSPQQREAAKRAVDAAPEGYEIEIREPRRSSPQNRRFFAAVGDLVRQHPEGRVHDKDTWKALLMSSAGFKCRFEPSLDGLGVVPIGFRSSELRRAEFAQLTEAAYAYGSQHGILWSEDR